MECEGGESRGSISRPNSSIMERGGGRSTIASRSYLWWRCKSRAANKEEGGRTDLYPELLTRVFTFHLFRAQKPCSLTEDLALFLYPTLRSIATGNVKSPTVNIRIIPFKREQRHLPIRRTDYPHLIHLHSQPHRLQIRPTLDLFIRLQPKPS